MLYVFGSLKNWGRLRKGGVRTPAIAFASDRKIDAEWRALNYHSRPDLDHARKEFASVDAILKATGADVIELPAGEGLTLDSLYTHDALIVTPNGLVLLHMGKPARRNEARINASHLEKLRF